MVGFVDLPVCSFYRLGGGIGSEILQTNCSVIVVQWMSGKFMKSWKLCGDS